MQTATSQHNEPEDHLPGRDGSEHHVPEHFVMVEQQLFDVHAILDVRRAELELVAIQLMDAQHIFEEANARVALAETPLAQREHGEARRRLHELQIRHERATQEVNELVSTKDMLLAKLVG